MGCLTRGGLFLAMLALVGGCGQGTGARADAGAPQDSPVGGDAEPACGNGAVEGTEQCDEGPANGTSGSCCSDTCTSRDDGTACEGGTCVAGTCAACLTVTGTGTPVFDSAALSAPGGSFSAELTAVVSAGDADAVVGLAAVAPVTWSDLAVIVRFNNLGTLDVRDGGTYRADATIAYAAGTRYRFRLAVDLTARRYTVRVTPEGGSEQLLAADYAFRTEQQAVTSLAWWGVGANVGTLTACLAGAGCPSGEACTAGGGCQAGTIDCTGGSPVCAGLANVANGTPCAGGTCQDGTCAGSQVDLGDCSQATVQAAIDGAADGTILVCPAGDWSWTKVTFANHDVTLRGQGIGQTRISVTGTNGIEAPTANTKPFRLSGFTFTSTDNYGIDDPGGYNAMIKVAGGKGWRIDHNELQIYSSYQGYQGGNGIMAFGDVAGVIDHNRFVNHPSQVSCSISSTCGCMHASVFPMRWVGSPVGVTSWDLTSQIGDSAYTIFVEDNYFHEAKQCSGHNAHAVYGGAGGIYVFRHNDVYNMNADSHGFESNVSTREYEISGNRWYTDAGRNIYRASNLRGGTGVIYGNTLQGSFTFAVGLTESRATTNTRGNPARPELYGGVPASSCCTTNEGYPCVDQIGRGQSSGTSPDKTQAADPLYIWGNSFGGATAVDVYDYGGGGCTGSTADYIQAGRDYFYSAGDGPKPGYVAYPYPHPLVGP